MWCFRACGSSMHVVPPCMWCFHARMACCSHSLGAAELEQPGAGGPKLSSDVIYTQSRIYVHPKSIGLQHTLRIRPAIHSSAAEQCSQLHGATGHGGSLCFSARCWGHGVCSVSQVATRIAFCRVVPGLQATVVAATFSVLALLLCNPSRRP